MSATAAWQNFLQQQGAQWDDNGLISTFGQAELERFLIKHGPVVTSLTHQALIKVTGSDAQSFLQGQLSSDITQVSDTQAQMSSYCDPKGNVLAVFIVFKYQGDFYLSFDASLAQSIEKRLQMFIMRSDVQLEDMRGTFAQVGFAGEFGDLDIQRRLNTKVKEVWEVGMVQQDEMQDIAVIKVPGPYHKYFLMGPAEQMIEAWTQLRANSDVTNNYDWQLLDIAAGVPQVNAQTSGEFTAQFLNLDKFEAINFKKGCFPGQEIIARLHYRGKVTKRMLRLRLAGESTLQSGDTLEAQDSNGKTHRFSVINQRPDIMGSGSLCLAIATIKSLEAVKGSLKDTQGNAIEIEPLPYRINDDE